MIVTLGLLAFVVLLIMSLATLTQIEIQTATKSAQLATARNNALLGLQIAVGELQKYAGPDQRATVPATTVYPEKDVTTATGELFDMYRDNAKTALRNTYLTPAERDLWETDIRDWWNTSNRNPYWTAVYDSSLRRDPQVGPHQYGEPKRNQLPVWLVSGNESLNFDPKTDTSYPDGYFTPDIDVATLATSADDVINIVDGAAPKAEESVDGLQGQVQVLRQPIQSASPHGGGHYAYWVADESTKANISVNDPYYNNSNPTSNEYRNRLQAPLRSGWEGIEGLDDASDAIAINSPLFEQAISKGQLSLIDPTLEEPIKSNFHHLTTHSKGLFTDTALGGLKKDLTTFLEGAGNSFSLNDTIADRNLYATNDPRFGANNSGFPVISSGTNLATWKQVKDWYDTTGSSGSMSVAPGHAPILANYRVFYAYTHENGIIQVHFLPCVSLWNPYDVALDNTTYELKWRHNFAVQQFGVVTEGMADPTPANYSDGTIVPNSGDGPQYLLHQLTGLDWYNQNSSGFKEFYTNWQSNELWTPEKDAKHPAHPSYTFAPFDRGKSLPDPSSPEATWVTYKFTTAFEPGQVKVFTIGKTQKVSASALHEGTDVVQLANGFDPDFPASYYFDIAQIVDPSGTGAATPDATHTMRIFALLHSVSTPNTMSMELFANGNSLWRNEFNGQPGNPVNGSVMKNTDMEAVSDDPSTWRIISDRLNWEGLPKGETTGNRSSPLNFLFHGILQPFALKQQYIYRSNLGFRMDNTSNYVRAFALYNISAPSMDLNKNLEGSRADYAGSNTDKYMVNQLMKAESLLTGTASVYPRWDNNQAEAAGSDTEGFALISWTKMDDLNNAGLTRIPFRKAHRTDADLLSLGQLQQANLSLLAWEPTYPVGNSEASPYVDRASIAGIESYPVGSAKSDSFGALPSYYREAGEMPNDSQNRQMDVSYLLNENLWDRYFLSSIPQSGPLVLDNTQRLPNSRYRFSESQDISTEDVRDFDMSAAYLENAGSFNVNSTSVEAWKALLTAFRGLRFPNDDRTGDAITNAMPVAFTLDPVDGNIEFTFEDKDDQAIGAAPSGVGRDYTKLFTGFRYLTDDMIEMLAKRIVDEIRLRGPFYSMSDFANRRLVSPDRSNNEWYTARTSNQSPDAGSTITHTYGLSASGYDPFVGMAGINGALQRAINLSGINGGVNYPHSSTDTNDRTFRLELDETKFNNKTNIPMEILPQVGHYLDTEHLAGVPIGEAGSLLSHAPGFVTQADILSMIGPALTARGDTFLVRSYGDAVNPLTGETTSRAWLEAVVQRTTTPVEPSGSTGIDRFTPADEFGRRFVIVSMRWLSEEEI